MVAGAYKLYKKEELIQKGCFGQTYYPESHESDDRNEIRQQTGIKPAFMLY
jgi:hypothetical protein